jgi:hypothetical protein
LLAIGEETQPIILDTTMRFARARSAKRRAIVAMPRLDATPAPPRPRWADGVVPRRR